MCWWPWWTNGGTTDQGGQTATGPAGPETDGARCVAVRDQREVPTRTVIRPVLLTFWTRIVVPVLGTSTPIHSGS